MEVIYYDPNGPSRFKRAKCTQTQDGSNALSVNGSIYASKPLIPKKKMRGEALPDAERSTNKNASTERDELTKTMFPSQDAAPAAILDNGSESEGTSLIAQDKIKKRDREFHSNDALINDWSQRLCEDTRQIALKINAERHSMQNDNIRLQRELDTARIEMQNQKRYCEKLNKGLRFVILEKRNVEYDLKVVRERKETFMRELKVSMEDTRRCNRRMALDRKIHIEKQDDLQKQLVSMHEENDRLNSSLQTTRKSLEDEKEKMLCQICMESPKDAFCQPCLHLHYCFPCLNKYVEQNKSCPSCRTEVIAVMRFYS